MARCVFMETGDLRRSNQILLGEQNRNEHKAEDNIHHRACDHNKEALPHRLLVKGPLIFARLVFPLHLDISAHGDQPQGIFCFPFAEAKKLWPHANGELIDLDARELSYREMPHLMDQDNQAKKQNSKQNGPSLAPNASGIK